MKPAKRARPLPASQLRWRCDPQRLGFRTTADVSPRSEIIGQPQALAAIRLGLECASPGYNVFVCGLTGTGKTTAIRQLFEELRVRGQAPPDLCFVHNFHQHDRPLALLLPAGRGRELQREMNEFIEVCRKDLPEVYESDAFQQRRRQVLDQYKEQGRSLFKAFETRVRAEQFQIVQIEAGPVVRADIYPVVGGEPTSLDKLRDLSHEKQFDVKQLAAIERAYEELSDEMQSVFKAGRQMDRAQRESLRALEREFGALVVAAPLHDLREQFADVPRVMAWLEQVEESILEMTHRVSALESSEDDPREARLRRWFDDYSVNLLVDNTGAQHPPVVIETTPTYKNLFGSIERAPDRRGGWRSDHASIRGGSILAANGGYLIVNLLDVAAETAVWPTLKRTLKNMKSEIQPAEPYLSLVGSPIKPEPVDLQLKVVLIGDAYTYHYLHEHDEEFRKIFKVKADFDSTMPRDRRAQRDYARFVASLAANESLLPFDAAAVAAVIEIGARLAGRQTKLSTRFSDIADVVREAHHWARKSGGRVVRAEHVHKSVRERILRVNLIERKLQEAFDTGQMLFDLRGKKVGQVNALTVYDVGDHVFGRPARITSQVSMGRSGIINIEREANLSGSTHDKGVLILAGYLRGMYAQDKPLTLSASLAFEQSYGGVDGDSASAAEVYALLSAIGNLAVRQDLAVTGSIDQRGQLQPVGGINEKIEGFFAVCRTRGLTGTQGVLIPAQNAPDLMLSAEVVEAARRGRFQVYAIRTIDQGLEILTGLRAGRRRGYRFEADTVHRRVDDALYELAESIKEFVDGSDSPAGGPPQQHGLTGEDGDDGEMRRRARRVRRALTARPSRRTGRGRA
jgi:ATP-dependent Lon protease